MFSKTGLEALVSGTTIRDRRDQRVANTNKSIIEIQAREDQQRLLTCIHQLPHAHLHLSDRYPFCWRLLPLSWSLS
jgi:Zn-dependent peptidase ImmA (M78 family)